MKAQFHSFIFALALLFLFQGFSMNRALGQNIEWTRQFGTADNDVAYEISVDASGVYVAGRTSGALPGQTSSGNGDAFIRKYDANGNEVWTRQFGTAGGDLARGISVDASGVYVCGTVSDALPGQTSIGDIDAFVRKYDVNGNEVWTRQFGTASGAYAADIFVDATGVYVTGDVNGALPGQTSSGNADVFVRKYDVNGNEVWTNQFGSAGGDNATEIFVDASGVYVSGFTFGALPGQTLLGAPDAFIRKYDANGNEVWTRQFGTASADYARGISVDASGVYVIGHVNSALPGQTFTGVLLMPLSVNTILMALKCGPTSSELVTKTMLMEFHWMPRGCMWLDQPVVPFLVRPTYMS